MPAQNQPAQNGSDPAQEKRLSAQEKAIHKQLVQSALLAFTALIAICAVGIAWFVNNSRVSGNGVEVQSSGAPFELASAGDVGQYPPSADVVGDKDTTALTTPPTPLYTTSGANTLVTWMVNGTSSLNNAAGSTKKLQPGSSGSITFYVLPKTAALGTLKFTLGLTPYQVSKNDTDAGRVQIADKIYAAPLDSTDTTSAAVYSLLQGHLLFFKNYNKATQTYSGWVDGSFTQSFTGKPVGTAVSITLYWVWPLQFTNYLYTGTGNLFATANDDFTALVTNNMNNAHERYFHANTGTLTLPNIDPSMDATAIKTCTGYYNAADELLGNSIRYLQLELTATEQ
ncbi:MAG: hypothetical protein PHO10_04700 [Gemmiger sp.]|nr:hypothetical protein [Gemmiger sp.]